VIDVSSFEPYSKVICPHCGETVRVRRRFDHFSIIKQIGEGGMSRVFDAEDAALGRHVALKILNRHYSKDSVRMASFEREAQLTAAVTHPNVVKLYSVGRDQGNFYIAMELVSGGSMEKRIEDKGRLTEAEALHVGRAAAEGLRAAFREGLIHRDVKPANILYTENNTPKIVDFGLALFHEKDVDESGEIWATPYYVAPEKVRDDSEDFRSDIYSLGATLYHALAGKPPHKANTNSIYELKIIKSQPVKLEDCGFKFSNRTCELVNKMLELKPEKRHQSYDELVEAFRDAESLLGYSAVGQKTRKQKMIFTLSISAVALVSVILLAVLFRPGGTKAKSINTSDGITTNELTDLGKTLAAGTVTVADVFLRARTTLLDGKYPEARKMFDELINSGRAKQPTLNWARFNAALCAIVDSQKKDADRYFKAIKKDADEGVEESGMDLKVFFGKVGGHWSKELESAGDGDVTYDTNSEEAMGYLAHGLAQWHFGKPSLAIKWLDTFNQSAPRKGLEWIGSYKKLIAPYLSDVELARTLGEIKKATSIEEARSALSQTRDVLTKLKTEGALRTQLIQYERSLLEDISKFRRIAEEKERLRLKALRERELAQITEMSETLPALVRGYDYRHVVDLLSGMKFETPEVQNAVANKIYLWSKAREFMDTLIADVNARGYTGSISRKAGIPLQGRLSKLDYDNITITMERGQFAVPSDTLAPEALINMAQFFCDGVSDSTDFYRREEMIVVFAKIQGLEQYVAALTSQLLEENRDFRLRWARVELSGS
jgi:serine/threonine protein kinase